MDALQSEGEPIVPDVAEGVWDVFWTLDRRRQGNGYEALAISHQEIEACTRLYGLRLRPWEVRALDAMEQARRKWLNTPEKERKSAKPLTPDLFRMMLG